MRELENTLLYTDANYATVTLENTASEGSGVVLVLGQIPGKGETDPDISAREIYDQERLEEAEEASGLEELSHSELIGILRARVTDLEAAIEGMSETPRQPAVLFLAEKHFHPITMAFSELDVRLTEQRNTKRDSARTLEDRQRIKSEDAETPRDKPVGPGNAEAGEDLKAGDSCRLGQDGRLYKRSAASIKCEKADEERRLAARAAIGLPPQ